MPTILDVLKASQGVAPGPMTPLQQLLAGHMGEMDPMQQEEQFDPEAVPPVQAGPPPVGQPAPSPIGMAANMASQARPSPLGMAANMASQEKGPETNFPPTSSTLMRNAAQGKLPATSEGPWHPGVPGAAPTLPAPTEGGGVPRSAADFDYAYGMENADTVDPRHQGYKEKLIALLEDQAGDQLPLHRKKDPQEIGFWQKVLRSRGMGTPTELESQMAAYQQLMGLTSPETSEAVKTGAGIYYPGGPGQEAQGQWATPPPQPQYATVPPGHGMYGIEGGQATELVAPAQQPPEAISSTGRPALIWNPEDQSTKWETPPNTYGMGQLGGMADPKYWPQALRNEVNPLASFPQHPYYMLFEQMVQAVRDQRLGKEGQAYAQKKLSVMADIIDRMNKDNFDPATGQAMDPTPAMMEEAAKQADALMQTAGYNQPAGQGVGDGQDEQPGGPERNQAIAAELGPKPSTPEEGYEKISVYLQKKGLTMNEGEIWDLVTGVWGAW